MYLRQGRDRQYQSWVGVAATLCAAGDYGDIRATSASGTDRVDLGPDANVRDGLEFRRARFLAQAVMLAEILLPDAMA